MSCLFASVFECDVVATPDPGPFDVMLAFAATFRAYTASGFLAYRAPVPALCQRDPTDAAGVLCQDGDFGVLWSSNSAVYILSSVVMDVCIE